MNKALFEYSAYSAFLKDWISAQPRKGHGLRLKMAECLGRQSVFISQVLHGDADLSASQAQILAEWMQLSDSETHYLLLLVQQARADTEKLKQYFAGQLTRIRDENLRIDQRLKGKTESIPEQDRLRYYSAWYYPAIRLLTAIPAYQTRGEIAKRLQLP
ncbi:MAG: TIGR02147 family protein, partial [Bdellovibrionota bacterium]